MPDFTPHLPLARKACDFFTASPDPFHAVHNSSVKLEAAGFARLRKREAFAGKVKPGGKYYYTVNKTTLVAFCVGEKYKSGGEKEGGGFKIIAGHTDSPNLKVKPLCKKRSGDYIQLGVECYGGGLWRTWFDRDLSLSGRVLVRNKNKGGVVEQKIVNLQRPIARISSLAIHLETVEERAAFKFNKEDQLKPILATMLEKEAKGQLEGSGSGGDSSWKEGQEPLLLDLLAKELSVEVEDIADFELNLYDTQPATIGGIHQEFLYSARLDNLGTVFAGTEALLAHSVDLSNDSDVSLFAAFDHEEVGSESAHGAGSPIMGEAVRRITSALAATEGGAEDSVTFPDLYASVLRKSFVLSSDMAHAQHPNYASKHESAHAPILNKGVVIKTNQNQRYTTNSVTGFCVREMARKAGIVTPQEFVVRNDSRCGSTIGPIVSANTGLRTVDLGMPQLSMHSCREVMGTADLTNGVELFTAFYKHFREIDDNLEG